MPYKRNARKRYYRRRRYGRRSYKRSYRRKSSMFRVATAATKKVLAKRVERKQFVRDAAPGIQTLSQNTALAASPLNNIAKGDDSWTRQGSSIFLRWMILKGWFVARSNFAAPGMMRTLKLRIMLIKHMGEFPVSVAPQYILGNVSVSDFIATAFQETPGGAVPLESIFNVFDHRQKKYVAVYDKLHHLNVDFVSTTVDLKPKAQMFRCAVRINKKIKYNDQVTLDPLTIEGYNYTWVVIPWSPINPDGTNIGGLGAAHFIHFTDS